VREIGFHLSLLSSLPFNMASTSVTLHYFPLGARGFATRVCARSAGIPFEDKRYTFPEWGPVKAEGKVAPLGQLPVLVVDNVSYCQSIPMSVYVAKLGGLYPTDALEQLKVDEVMGITDEVWNKIGATKSDDPSTRVAYGYDVAPKYLQLLEARLTAAGGKFFHGETPGVADCWVYQWTNFFASGFFDHVPLDFVEKGSPAIAAFVARFKASELYVTHGNPE
jgi:glutathione S-transferase